MQLPRNTAWFDVLLIYRRGLKLWDLHGGHLLCEFFYLSAQAPEIQFLQSFFLNKFLVVCLAVTDYFAVWVILIDLS